MRRPAATGILLVASASAQHGGTWCSAPSSGGRAVLDEPGTSALDTGFDPLGGLGALPGSTSSCCPASSSSRPRSASTTTSTGRPPGSASIAAFGVLGRSPRCWAGCAGRSPCPASPTRGRTRPRRPPSEATAATRIVLNGYASAAWASTSGELLQGIWAGGRRRPPAFGRDACPGGSFRPRAVVGRRGGPRLPTATAWAWDAGVLGPQRLHRVVPVAARARSPAPAPARAPPSVSHGEAATTAPPSVGTRRPASSRAAARRRASRAPGRPSARAARGRDSTVLLPPDPEVSGDPARPWRGRCRQVGSRRGR